MNVVEADVLVAGSGAGGMTAALVAAAAGHSVVVCREGGPLGRHLRNLRWIRLDPGQPPRRREGADDSAAEACTYLRHVVDAVRH